MVDLGAWADERCRIAGAQSDESAPADDGEGDSAAASTPERR